MSSNLFSDLRHDLMGQAPGPSSAQNSYAEAALTRHKREGLELAVRARWIALGSIAVLLVFLNASWGVLYFHAFLAGFALIGYLQRKVGRAGRSRAELGLLFCDLALLTFTLSFPPPFPDMAHWPTATTYKFGNFVYFYVILAAGTLSYNWRTIMAVGNWTFVLWALAVGLIWLFGQTMPELDAEILALLDGDQALFDLINPNAVQLDLRLQEAVVFLIVAYTLALTSWRFERLLRSHAGLERTRVNLGRYFSPNMVDALAENDTPLREVREQDVAVMFVDLVGFTSYAAERAPREVIETLRAFHARIEACVFDHGGTLDKYLGDGLMASFGTPVVGKGDTARALLCAREALEAVDDLNMKRAEAGDMALQVSVGLHYGPVVMGDIGVNRLEYTLIGNTVNVASRMESLTRSLSTRLVLSDAAYTQAQSEGAPVEAFVCVDGEQVRGIAEPMRVWRLP